MVDGFRGVLGLCFVYARRWGGMVGGDASGGALSLELPV